MRINVLAWRAGRQSVATADGLTDAAPEIGEEVRLIMLSSWLDSDHLP